MLDPSSQGLFQLLNTSQIYTIIRHILRLTPMNRQNRQSIRTTIHKSLNRQLQLHKWSHIVVKQAYKKCQADLYFIFFWDYHLLFGGSSFWYLPEIYPVIVVRSKKVFSGAKLLQGCWPKLEDIQRLVQLFPK